MAFLGYCLKSMGWRTTMVVGILGHAVRFAVFAFVPIPAVAIAVVQPAAQVRCFEATGKKVSFLRAVRAELRQNRTLAQAVHEVPLPPDQHWLLADANHPRNVTASFTELEWE